MASELPIHAHEDASKLPEDVLKELLLSDELRILDQVHRSCRQLEGRVGDDASLQKTLRAVIVETLRDAGIRDHERLSGVLAPLVLSSLREEIRNSRDTLVDALYPVTGRLVATAVRNNFRELLGGIESKVAATFSPMRWLVFFKALFTGQSVAELLLERNSPFKLNELLVLHRQTGLLIARSVEDEARADAVDSDLVGGMLTAIMSFTRDAFGEGAQGELKTLQFGDSELFLRCSPAVILAVRVSGAPPADFDGALEILFTDFLDRWGNTLRDFDGSLGEQDTEELVTDLRARFTHLLASRKERVRRPSSYRRVYLILALLLFGLGYWYVNGRLDARRVAKTEAAAQQAIASMSGLTGYPLAVEFDLAENALRVSGLVPDEETQDRLNDAIKQVAPDAALRLDVSAVKPSTSSFELAAQRVLATQPELKGYPLAAEYDTAAEVLRVSGLVPDAAALERLRVALEAGVAGIPVEMSVAALPEAPTPSPILETARAAILAEATLTGYPILFHLDGDTLRVTGLVDNITARDRAQRVLADALPGVKLDMRVRMVRTPKRTAVERLVAWTEVNAIFFSNLDEFRDPVKADLNLRAVVQHLMATPPDVGLRVVGYTDPLGSSGFNQKLAIRRAEVVAESLVNRGVPAARLTITGRPGERLLTTVVGQDSDSRRVEFEMFRKGRRGAGDGY